MKQKLQDFIESHPLIFVFLGILVFNFFANFIKFYQFGLYGDDWGASTYIYTHNPWQAVVAWWVTWGGEVGNFRLVAALIPFFWFCFYWLFGVYGGAIFNLLLYTGLAFVAFLVFEKIMQKGLAFFSALLLLVYPTTAFFAWQVTETYVLSMLFVLLSVFLFWEKRKIWALVFLLCSILTNESMALLFLLAAFPQEVFSVQNFKTQTTLVLKWLMPVLIFYGIFRLLGEKIGFISGQRLQILSEFQPLSFIIQFFTGAAATLVTSWGMAGWKILQSFEVRDIFLAIIVFFLTGSALYFGFANIQNSGFLKARAFWLMGLGLLLGLAGRYYGFYYVPSINTLDLNSRHFFAATLGAIIFFAGFFEFLMVRLKSSFIIYFWVFLVFILTVLSTFKFQVQKDYARAWVLGQRLTNQLFLQVPALSPGQGVVVEVIPKPLGRIVDLSDSVWDLRLLVPRVYGPKTYGFLSTFIQRREAKGIEWCIDSSPVYKNLCLDRSQVFVFRWDGNNLQSVSKNYKTLTKIKQQTLPENLKKILEN